MKNIFIVAGFAVALILSGCQKNFLEKTPPDRLPEEGFINSDARALAVVNAAYIPLASNNLFGDDNISLRLFDPPSGDVILGAAISGQVFNTFSFSADDPHLMAFYSGLYEGVYRSNVVIKNVPDVQMDEALKKRYVGEAKFLRALYYFYLTAEFGEVPLFTEPFTDPDEALIAKSPIADIQAVMIQDLKDAIEDLPVSYGANDLGRATSGAAKSLLGKVYLYMKDYENAEKYFREVMESGTYQLMDDFNHIINRNYENNAESIFEIQFASAAAGATQNVSDDREYHQWPQVNGGSSEISPTQSIVDEFEPGDPRLNYSIFNYEGQPFAPELSTSSLNLDVYKKSWSPTGYNVRKGQIPVLFINARGTNFPLIRYADVLLMYAEAANELSMFDEARDAINQVRQRPSVNMPALTVAQTDTKEKMFKAIVHERRVELAFEQHRYDDLKRWGLADSVLAPLGYTARNRYFPLPQLELDVNPNLKQLSGW
jgi:hypothetical protein